MYILYQNKQCAIACTLSLPHHRFVLLFSALSCSFPLCDIETLIHYEMVAIFAIEPMRKTHTNTV